VLEVRAGVIAQLAQLQIIEVHARQVDS
jgi:hypothetical protein